MMTTFADELSAIATNNYNRASGAMYGSAANMAPGAGVFLIGVTYALFDDKNERFRAMKGAMLVLTHECDIEQDNNRDYNEQFIGIPMISIRDVASAYETLNRKPQARTLVQNAAMGRMNRLYFLPPPPFDVPEMDLGALVYLNAITSNHIKQIDRSQAERSFSLSSYGLEYADLMLKQHLFRPKDDPIPNYGMPYRGISITTNPRP